MPIARRICSSVYSTP